DELHSHERRERRDKKACGIALRLIYIGRRERMRGSDALAGPHQVHAGSTAPFVWILKPNAFAIVVAAEPERLEHFLDLRKVGPADQQVEVSRRPRGARVRATHPRRY